MMRGFLFLAVLFNKGACNARRIDLDKNGAKLEKLERFAFKDYAALIVSNIDMSPDSTQSAECIPGVDHAYSTG